LAGQSANELSVYDDVANESSTQEKDEKREFFRCELPPLLRQGSNSMTEGVLDEQMREYIVEVVQSLYSKLHKGFQQSLVTTEGSDEPSSKADVPGSTIKPTKKPSGADQEEVPTEFNLAVIPQGDSEGGLDYGYGELDYGYSELETGNLWNENTQNTLWRVGEIVYVKDMDIDAEHTPELTGGNEAKFSTSQEDVQEEACCESQLLEITNNAVLI
jgi:hypothetical protein